MGLLEELKEKRAAWQCNLELCTERMCTERDNLARATGMLADIDRAISALTPAPAQEGEEETLGRFGHHPDALQDFLVEVECLQGSAHDARCGLAPIDEVMERIFSATTFSTGGTAEGVDAKELLYKLYGELETFKASQPASEAPHAEGGETSDDGEAMRSAHSIMPGSGATFKTDEEIRESVRPHASDCARNNEPAHPAGKCDCTLRLKWTPYSEIAPKAPAELAGYSIETRFSEVDYEWVYRHVPIAASNTPDPLSISASAPHAAESDAVKEQEAAFWAKHLVKA